MKRSLISTAGLAAAILLSGTALSQSSHPNPVITLTRQETYQSAGKEFTRYIYAVANYEAYPDELFAASPDLPPCGSNKNSSRTWVDVFEQSGKRLYGFCAFSKSSDLNKIWFALEAGVTPPSWVYIEMNDRKTNTKYKSNLAETVP